MTPTSTQAELTERVRALLAGRPSTREIAMFGGRSFMVNDKLTVCTLKGGGLLVRVPPERHAELTGRPGAGQAEMGAGRTMGPGWVEVAAGSVGDDAELSFWLGVALEHNHRLTGTRSDRR